MDAKVGLASQWCVDKDFQGQGLIQKIYNYFEMIIAGKYDFIEASIRKNNPAGSGNNKIRHENYF